MAEALKLAAISRFKDPAKVACCAEEQMARLAYFLAPCLQT